MNYGDFIIDEAADWSELSPYRHPIMRFRIWKWRQPFLGEMNWRGRLRYRWAKMRGRIHGEFYWSGK